MALTFVQSDHNDVAGGSSVAITFDSTPTAGNLIVVCAGIDGADPGTTAVADNKGNTYTRDVIDTQGGARTAIYWAKDIATSATHTVTFTPGGASFAYITAYEFSGGDTSTQPDTTAGTGGATGTSISSGTSGTTTIADCVAMSTIGTDQGNTDTINPEAGYTTPGAGKGENENGAGFYANSSAYKVLTGTGTEECTWTLGGSHTASACISVFRGTAGAAAVRAKRLLLLGVA